MEERTSINYMSDLEIVEYINHYIDRSNYNYAVLIDGSWGSGKTYFIKNVLMSAIKEHEKLKNIKDRDYKEKKIIYTSLYGITTKEELIRQISIEALPFSNIIKSKGVSALSSIGKAVLGGVLSYNSITLSKDSFDISNYVSIENSILIFDDLERCNMDINEVLGYINNFVEHDGIKTIIVSNEKEISSTKLITNREFKLLVALNRDIVFPKEEKVKTYDNLFNQESSKDDEKLDLNELSKRVNTLFGEDRLYKQIKEKLIGVTIYYRCDFNKIIDDIIKSTTKNEKIQKIIINNKNYIIEQLEYYQHHNIRTLLFCLDKYNIIAESLINEINSKMLEEILGNILRYIMIISICYKTGRDLPKWNDKNEIQMVSFDQKTFGLNSTMKGFRFVDDFVLGANYISSKAVDVINRAIEIQKNQLLDQDDSFYKISNGWWLLDDSEALKLIHSVNQSLKNEISHYNMSMYIKILYFNIFFNRLGIQKEDISGLVEIMKNNVRYFDDKSSYNSFGWDYAEVENEEDRELLLKYIKELNDNLKHYREKISIKDINAIFDDKKTWIDSIIEYVDKSKNSIIEQRAFLSLIDSNILVETIKESNNEQIMGFRGVLQSVYYPLNIKEYYVSDLESIRKLISELINYVNNIRINQKIRAKNIDYLINDLDSIVQKLI
ncbi:P-loop NTPase fold protein [Clostridium beijerinckii]|uniref:P-loop NTPase fold protein n=1 Tax=Clostridium beijerinckii TaxID=1520 RepID=UPI0013615C99|nr:P-loop NTPase fold protein [Clostridium beijerinckii]MZK50966.1 hypothetical protein [Clostridium beijerinckii]MZK59168.1 hypothetical protein [Clostridium beijerinckii]MZK69287.1 hypothetical protein [Clostridium beijerinckii]MZK74660.1 hypothetical protein [Clostridium beijerinckii]MZK84379.1 hypothetical protein [Clostridium beijerinckii]